MSGPFDSLGVGVAVAGAIITLAGMFLTPMRGVVLRAMRVRMDALKERQRPATIAAAPETAPAGPSPAAATPAPPPAPTPKITLTPSEQRAAEQREQEALFARALLTAQKTAEDLVRNAQLEAQEITDRAEAAAADTTRASRRNAAEIVQKAQQDADLIVASAKQKAAAWLALLQAEADKLAAEAHQAFQGAQRTVEQNVTSLNARFERRMAEWNADPWERNRAAGPDGAAQQNGERSPTRIA